MKLPHTMKTLAGLAIITFFALTNQVNSADDLGSVFKEAKFDKIEGEWADPGGNVSTFSWKYPGHVIESTTTMGDVARYSMFWFDKKDKQVRVVSVGSNGSSSFGTAEFSQGKAVIKIDYVRGNGENGSFTIHYTLSGDELTVEMEGNPDSKTVLKRK